ncbi:MAG: hypothetical protein ABI655_06075 [Phenylobacterium sp.]
MRIAAILALAALAGCTTPVVDGAHALNGHDLQDAVGLYGPWDARITLAGQPRYIWRRAVILNGQTYYCELHAKTGFKTTAADTLMHGNPAACGLFSVRYEMSRRPEEPRVDDPRRPTAQLALNEAQGH